MYDELTEQDIKKMEEEIEYRKLVVRKEALEAVKEARAQGDLSENFEYHAAKKDKNQNESRDWQKTGYSLEQMNISFWEIIHKAGKTADLQILEL